MASCIMTQAVAAIVDGSTGCRAATSAATPQAAAGPVREHGHQNAAGAAACVARIWSIIWPGISTRGRDQEFSRYVAPVTRTVDQPSCRDSYGDTGATQLSPTDLCLRRIVLGNMVGCDG